MMPADGDGLLQDIGDWHNTSSPRPKLRVLGPVVIDASGPSPTSSGRFYAGMLAYLTCHPEGVCVEQVAEACGGTHPLNWSRIRTNISVLRRWLGRDPGTGEFYLPLAVMPSQVVQPGDGGGLPDC